MSNERPYAHGCTPVGLNGQGWNIPLAEHSRKVPSCELVTVRDKKARNRSCLVGCQAPASKFAHFRSAAKESQTLTTFSPRFWQIALNLPKYITIRSHFSGQLLFNYFGQFSPILSFKVCLHLICRYCNYNFVFANISFIQKLLIKVVIVL